MRIPEGAADRPRSAMVGHSGLKLAQEIIAISVEGTSFHQRIVPRGILFVLDGQRRKRRLRPALVGLVKLGELAQ